MITKVSKGILINSVFEIKCSGMLLCPGHLQVNRPSIGSASSYQHVFFKMDVPKAQNVAVVVGTEWTQLEQKEPGSWHGEVGCHYSVAVSCFFLYTDHVTWSNLH